MSDHDGINGSHFFVPYLIGLVRLSSPTFPASVSLYFGFILYPINENNSPLSVTYLFHNHRTSKY